jgi:hypothetical protein
MRRYLGKHMPSFHSQTKTDNKLEDVSRMASMLDRSKIAADEAQA